jgi:urease beta subunit
VSFASLLTHDIAIERPFRAVFEGEPILDPEGADYGQPEREYVSVTEEVRGLIQPRTVREVALSTDAGAQVSMHVGFFTIDTDLTHADRLHLIQTGEVFDIEGIRSVRFGSEPHHEVDCELVTSAADPQEAGS